jgi:lipopolysaccharide/colanic/teichoic acid biosynthesis glycosyltransferase
VYKRQFLHSSHGADSLSNAVIWGTDFKAVELAKKLIKNYSSPYSVVGLIGPEIQDIGKNYENIEVLGSTGNLRKTIKDNNVKNVIFASDSIEFDKIFSIISECQGENVNFLISGNELDYMVGKSNITHIDNVPLLKVDYNISRTSHKVIKRIFDFILSAFMLIFIFPFSFWIIKKRTGNSFFKKIIANLPLVFSGRKSFVGPRSADLNSNLYLGNEGITGLWYVENVSSGDYNENRRLDLFYAKNQNIWLDLEIIGKSIAKQFISGR